MPDFKHRTILIIDDDQSSIDLIAHILEKKGFTSVESALSAAQGIAKAQMKKPDIVLLDIVMPEMDGYTCCRKLRDIASEADMPIIMITGGGVDSEEAITRSYDAGATDFITKPIWKPELLTRIRCAIKLKEACDRMQKEIERRKTSEQALRLSENRVRAIMESTADAIIIADNNWNIVFWNKSAAHIFGYTSDEVLGTPIMNIVPEQLREENKHFLQKIIDSGKTYVIGETTQSMGVKKDGTVFPVETSNSFWMDGGRYFFAAFVRDISPRKKRAADAHPSPNTTQL